MHECETGLLPEQCIYVCSSAGLVPIELCLLLEHHGLTVPPCGELPLASSGMVGLPVTSGGPIAPPTCVDDGSASTLEVMVTDVCRMVNEMLLPAIDRVALFNSMTKERALLAVLRSYFEGFLAELQAKLPVVNVHQVNHLKGMCFKFYHSVFDSK